MIGFMRRHWQLELPIPGFHTIQSQGGLSPLPLRLNKIECRLYAEAGM